MCCMRIAILGALGFLGKNLAKHLSTQGHEVTGFVLDLPKDKAGVITYAPVSQLFYQHMTAKTPSM